jgi:NADPH-dependent 2,4-dienoyl-CoA reductase/sulfur reductase-like enzyme
MLFPEAGIGARSFPPDLSEYITQYYRHRGVEVHPGEVVNGLRKEDHHLNVTTDIGDSFMVDGVVAGLGIAPSTELAQEAGLQTDNGIQVDEYLRTSQKDIYAAGDVASFFNRMLDRRMRVEHEDNANTMGMLAGENMARSLKDEPESPYHHLPFFYSDLFDLSYEAVGELDSRLETVSDWEKPYEKGVVYYLSNGRVRGVLLWNVWNQIEAARELIASSGPYTPENIKGRILM